MAGRRRSNSARSILRDLPAAALKFIPPMLAKPSLFLPEAENWIYEIKLDGYRALVVKKQSDLGTSLRG
jgi:ATP-dependent DNA ligase